MFSRKFIEKRKAHLEAKLIHTVDATNSSTMMSKQHREYKVKQHIPDIEAALRRINNGTYGFCTTCAEAISRKRLQFNPHVSRCLTCQQDHEK